uniref:CUB domain-containing protein n=1 Tax=Pinguiococcus pyrenoidosus TaxID=172671 RepID=A0A7R9UF08_9STRA|mmetsp:Transcript_8214/g.30860  ORF Transcript_8214/g.30860 Transcript_8214/m.30860 type:complete len:810 (+) Transcript_8214:217-2646(+)
MQRRPKSLVRASEFDPVADERELELRESENPIEIAEIYSRTSGSPNSSVTSQQTDEYFTGSTENLTEEQKQYLEDTRKSSLSFGEEAMDDAASDETPSAPVARVLVPAFLSVKHNGAEAGDTKDSGVDDRGRQVRFNIPGSDDETLEGEDPDGALDESMDRDALNDSADSGRPEMKLSDILASGGVPEEKGSQESPDAKEDKHEHEHEHEHEEDLESAIEREESLGYLRASTSAVNASMVVKTRSMHLRTLFRRCTEERPPPLVKEDFELQDMMENRQKHLREWSEQILQRTATIRGHLLAKRRQHDQTQTDDASDQLGRLIQSPHPYAEDSDEWHEITIAGADYIKVWFHPDTSTVEHVAYLTFHAEQDASSPHFGAPKYSGPKGGGNFPMSDNPLYIEGSTAYLHFVSDDSTPDYGYQLFYEAAQDYVPPRSNQEIYESALARPDAVEVESEHPYRADADERRRVQVPNADRIGIVFHEDTSTEKRYDYLEFFADEELTDSVSERFKGGLGGTAKNFPGVDGKPPIEFEGDTIYYRFVSDGSNHSWGYKFTVYPVFNMFKAVCDMEPADYWATAHPYQDDHQEDFRLHIPGARDIKIAFHPSSETERGYDYVKLFSNAERTEPLYRPVDRSDRFTGESGGRNWPQVSAPMQVQGDTVWGTFHADGETGEWGVEIVAWDANMELPRDPFEVDANPGIPAQVSRRATAKSMPRYSMEAWADDLNAEEEDDEGPERRSASFAALARALSSTVTRDSESKVRPFTDADEEGDGEEKDQDASREKAAAAMMSHAFELSTNYRLRYMRLQEER